MAEQSQNPGAVTNSFTKGMVKDYNETFIGEGLWTHARNLVNNSHDGHVGVVGNEPANLSCVTLPYTLIGSVHLTDDLWAIFTTDDVNSEIGLFDESQCSYTKKVNDPCLGFKRTNLITGISRKRYDCERPVYWSDGLNPDRFIDLENPPYKYTDSIVNDCVVRTYSTNLDCEKIRIAALINHPCLKLEKGRAAGTLPNGSYQVCVAYTINQVRITDYMGLTEVQSLFDHDNVSSALEITVLSVDQNFDEFELVIVAQINNQTIARRVGYYSTNQGTIFIDSLSNEAISIPIADVVVRTEPIEKSDAMYDVNNYALRVGAYTKAKFNFQPQANKIEARWIAVQYPAEYYHKAGNNTGYMRDEQYSFFIRWIYNTGERSESYHIPGRIATASEQQLIFGNDAFETLDGVQVERWQVENTATVDNLGSYTLSDGGRVIGSGKMGYWESTEKYPDDKPNIWGDLCGKPIRHHKFPDESVDNTGILNNFAQDGEFINILGVQFSNITHPLDNKGNPIASIVGYEILRGSRQGNKSILAKGMFNNMRSYTIPGNTSIEGLYQNYPYNDLRADSYLTADFQSGTNGSPDPKSSKLTGYKKNVFSFHSPETTFTNPFIDASEVKIYQEIHGTAKGSFVTPYKHPKFKMPTDFADIFTNVISIIKQVADIATAIGAADTNVTLQGDQDIPFTQSLVSPHRQEAVSGAVLGFTNGYFGTTGAPGADQVASATRQTKNTIITAANIAVLVALAPIRVDITSEQFLKLILAVIPYRQYAAQYVSHGLYNKSKGIQSGNRRRKVLNTSYINSGVQNLSTKYQLNNINRGKFVAVEIPQSAELPVPTVQDDSRFLISEKTATLGTVYNSNISAYYGALKIPIAAQYGQLDSIKQLVISNCVSATTADKTKKFTSPVIFGGDTYINRFTEKNSMMFFNSWLMGEPNGAEFDYSLYFNLPYARFWINNTNLSGGLFKLASDFRVLDFRKSPAVGFGLLRGYFYLFNSGVRDFFVESEVNIAYRDWEDQPNKRHYDPNRYTDLTLMFRSDSIKEPNYFKYDYSLSVSKLFNSQITWGNMLPRDFDPQKAETCYSYYPDRVLYSLPQQLESKKDNWRVYLANNFKDFGSPVTSIKSINRTGALFMMRRQSPMQFMGVEELKMDGTGAKITIGDGALFNQPLQALVNTENSFEYGSCQNKYAVINTTHGVFWVSQNQGKVFNYAGQINEISRNGMKWWLAENLPSHLLKAYPSYPLFDNPVKGIGVQMMYDNTHEILYITKKDYKPKRSNLLYDNTGFYYISGYTTVVNPPVTTTTCPPGYTLINNQCTRVSSLPPIESGTVVNLTRTPYEVYGNLGTRIYDNTTGTTNTLLSTSNPFWIRTASPGNWNTMTAAEKQAYDLNNGPVNRLAVWGNNNGANLNNYDHNGADLLPVGQWIGFDVCINITQTKTYYVAIAADNEYRFSLDGTLILSQTSGATSTFNYLHIYPVTITAGSHTLRVEGKNNGAKAGFGCEIYDLSELTNTAAVVSYLNAQTDYTNLATRIIFTTRTSTQFSSNLYTCPTGYGLVNPSCTLPICQQTQTVPPVVTITPGSTIQVPIKAYTPFTDPNTWDDASWTLSYDCKNQMWLSFHDWKPTFMLPGKNHFMTVNGNSIWKHNQRCDLFCNFYGVDYPFDIEFVTATGQTVNSVRSIEYLMEAYRFYNGCQDKFHILDQNFDQAVVYNSEQVSGVLELTLKDKRNPVTMLSYPQIQPQSIKILYSKEEQKYRFNQFWDVTKDRGEFSGVSLPMFITKANGYDFAINPTFINLQKSPLQRKKFRHNVNHVWLRKLKSGDVKLLFKISNQKILQSPR
jgi:hypothetical protein